MRLRIRDLREDRDLTQKEIADYLLCDQSSTPNTNAGSVPYPWSWPCAWRSFTVPAWTTW